MASRSVARSRSVPKTCPSCGNTYPGGEMFCPEDGTRLTGTAELPVLAQEDALVGAVLADRYRVLRRVGEGGMGVVYEGEHVVIEKRVAIKVLREDYTKRPEVLARFRQEARSASKIGHDNIVDVTDFGTTPSGGVFFVMEFLEGEDLADVLRRDRCVALPRGIHIMKQVCRALAAAHSKGIIHRDLKPENIYLIERDGRKDIVKLLDFGIAKISELDEEAGHGTGRRLTKTGMIFGTPEYMSPEQAAGKPLDHRVDIYATGIILYEIFAGRVPFMGDTFMGVLTQHLFEAPPPMRTWNPALPIPPTLEATILKAIAKDANRRHQTMQELLDDIERAAQGPDAVPLVVPAGTVAPEVLPAPAPALQVVAHSHVAAPTAPDLRVGPEVRGRSRLPAILIGVGLLVGVAGLAAWILGEGRTTEAAVEERGVTDEPRTAAGAVETDTRPDPPVPPPLPDPEIRITVETTPAGAVVEAGGRQVCESTPCTFQHARGEEIEITARRGRMVAEKSVTPEENTTIGLTLAVPIRTGGGAHAKKGGGGGHATGGGGGGGGSAGDLKIPSIWKNGQ